MDSYQTLRNTMIHRVKDVRHLSDSAFVLRCSRNNLQFTPGQHISVGPQHDIHMREYSVYSGNQEDFLEILVKEIPEGLVSRKLKTLKPEEEVKIEGPFGYFTIEEEEKDLPLYMIATGTGIAPFHCFALSYLKLPFTILHGVRHIHELYECNTFENNHHTFIPCITGESIEPLLSSHPHAFQGRVSEYIRTTPLPSEGIYFLCGNCDMIYEVFDILQEQGVPPQHIKAEVYF